MQYFVGEGLGKVLIIELARGEELFSGVEAVLKKEGIRNAYIASAVGSTAHLEYHRPMTMGAAAEDEMLSLEGPFEFGSISGTAIDGVLHFHFTAGGTKGNHIGHLEPGTTVLYLLELVVMEIKGFELERKMTPEKVKRLFPKE